MMNDARITNIHEPSDVDYSATITEDLNRYLHKHHGCWCANFSGKYHLASTRDPNKGKVLARNVTFDEMMTIALARPTE